MPKYCPNCGTLNPDEAVYCVRCGYTIDSFPYYLTVKIGDGPNGYVFRGINKVSGAEYAIKFFNVFNQQTLTRIGIWQGLNHPNILKPLDFDFYPKPFIVLPLSTSVKMTILNKNSITNIIVKVLLTLKYLHSQGIIHGNIKPSNVFVNGKISDLIPSNDIIYASPEQLTDDPIDEKTDVYRVCETYYELTYGRPPFEGNNVEIVDKKLKGIYKQDDPIIRNCLSPKKEERPTVDELLSRFISSSIKFTDNDGTYAELAYYYVLLERYDIAMKWLKKITRVNTSSIIALLQNNANKQEILDMLARLRANLS